MPNLIIAVKRPNVIPESVNTVRASSYNSYSLSNFGKIRSQGFNATGQLGNNSITNRDSPVSLGGAAKTFCKIGGGRAGVLFGVAGFDQNFNIAIDQYGRLWSWGLGTNGQLGNNATQSQRTPVSVLGSVKTFCQVGSGAGAFSNAIDKYGRVWSWGINTIGQLGNNAALGRCTPVAVSGATKTFCSITQGGSHSMTLDLRGRAWGWGSNSNGQIGDNSATNRCTPVSVLGSVKTFCEISAGSTHTLGLTNSGRAWSWGLNTNGQLGNNSVTSQRTPVSVLGAVKTFCKISCGLSFSMAIDKNGRVWGWGRGDLGELGNNLFSLSILTPVSIGGSLKTFCQISAGTNHSLAVDKNGKIWGWGYNYGGELGKLTNITPSSIVGNNKTFCHIGSGSLTSTAIDNRGRVWSWGSNDFGTLGDNTISLKTTPISIVGTVKTFCKISTGTNHVMAIEKNGRVWSWGLNSVGQLGDNGSLSQRTPVSILGAVKTFCQISAGNDATLSIDKNGRAWGWGVGTSGVLGRNSTLSVKTPVSVLGAVKTFCKINTSIGNHTLAIDNRGRVWSWGLNSSGQLGNNAVISQLTPVRITGSTKTFCVISTGNGFSLAIDKNGRAWGWGVGTGGVLGYNQVTSQRTPVSVLGAVKTFCEISAGTQHSLALDKNGKVWAWGVGSRGQLGNNSFGTVSVLTPVSVLGSNKTFCDISAGNLYSLATDQYGKTWAWGYYVSGQLGNNLYTATPVSISYL